jgi:hypothetical protein
MNTFVHTSPYGPRGKRCRVATYVAHRNGGASQFKCLSEMLSYDKACELAKIYSSFPANHTTRRDCSCEACTFDFESFTAALEGRAPFIEQSGAPGSERPVSSWRDYRRPVCEMSQEEAALLNSPYCRPAVDA